MRSRGRHLLRLVVTTANVAVLLFVAGCGLAADFAAPTATPVCAGPGCPPATPAPIPAAVTAIPSADSAATPHGPSVGTTPASAPATETRPPSSPGAFASAEAALGPIIWTTEVDPETRAPRTSVTSFTTNVPIMYATVAVERVRAGTEFGAEWTYNRTRLEAFDETIVADAAGEHMWIEFHLALTQPGLWPSGVYEVAISVNGQPAVVGRIEVNDPGV